MRVTRVALIQVVDDVLKKRGLIPGDILMVNGLSQLGSNQDEDVCMWLLG